MGGTMLNPSKLKFTFTHFNAAVRSCDRPEYAGGFPALFLLLAVLGAAMAGAALASLFYRQGMARLPLWAQGQLPCCRVFFQETGTEVHSVLRQAPQRGGAGAQSVCDAEKSAHSSDPVLYIPSILSFC